MSSALFVQEVRPAKPHLDFVHDFKGYGTHPSQCRVRVFTDVPAYSIGDERWIVVFTDLGVGTSVTNAADQLATEILYKLPLANTELGKLFTNTSDEDAKVALALAAARGGFVSWIEHYPALAPVRVRDAFDRISFSAFDTCGPYYARGPMNFGFSGTSWRRIERAEVERLIGGRFK